MSKLDKRAREFFQAYSQLLSDHGATPWESDSKFSIGGKDYEIHIHQGLWDGSGGPVQTSVDVREIPKEFMQFVAERIVKGED